MPHCLHAFSFSWTNAYLWCCTSYLLRLVLHPLQCTLQFYLSMLPPQLLLLTILKKNEQLNDSASNLYIGSLILFLLFQVFKNILRFIVLFLFFLLKILNFQWQGCPPCGNSSYLGDSDTLSLKVSNGGLAGPDHPFQILNLWQDMLNI